MDVIVDELIIEEDRPEHIARHKVTVDEVLEIVSGDYLVIEGKLGRYLLVGTTVNQRLITVVVGIRSGVRRNYYMKVRLVKKGTIKPMKPFKSLEEEANFWDTHDGVEVFGKDIKVGFHQSLKSDTLTIRFQPEYIQILKEKALLLGIGPTTLVRMWVMEKLKSLGRRSKQSEISSQAVLHKISK